ncbi:NAD(P)H-hydrate dehydratase [Reyranella sp. CPCC 100927]|uniref:NAD(P)H-hydrate dehydratase n=1 Tax=Reyranella sp. CPCC 100927 TaxID=2599616 RepID=UPI0011B4DAE1|nr:NAD(P)H-hydrate dehydratase [Reyranella sp. CPCC 100927]TWT09557.1 NAD(P)H-hydrate dehydratase [Reyranella sp. CPCC 100927]
MADLAADDDLVLLTCAEMQAAERYAMRGAGPEQRQATSGSELMEAAGAAVANTIIERFLPQPIVVLCGPGNNGGDGFVIARHLAAAGWPVRVGLLGDRAKLTGDAMWAAILWDGAVEPLSPALLADRPLVVDALFGAGLKRPIDGVAGDVIAAINSQALTCIAVDLPSGLEGDTGRMLGHAPRCALTVTFFRLKPAHLSLNGRLLCGDVRVADIGVPRAALKSVSPRQWRNAPALWRAALRAPALGDHKYARGHVLVAGGDTMTGAARLAALAARRIGAGLVTIAAAPAAVGVYQAAEPGNIVAALDGPNAFRQLAADPRRNVFVVGPGAGATPATRRLVADALATGRACVLDADALTAFAGAPQALFADIKGPAVLTPHDGEFSRLFPDLGADMGKLERARQAARMAGAVVLLKGADTVIAAPDGRAVINDNAPPWLATAGAGDVLAGLIAGLAAQGMTPFVAAVAAAWIHGAAAARFGPGLIAEDLPAQVPKILADLLDGRAGA